jgi:Peptidase family C25/CARDB
MKNFLLILVLVAFGKMAGAQNYNNEWIDYNKTYYKFKVATTGLVRISQPNLSTIGLGSTPAEHFQIWKNGEEVTLYTTVASGVLGGADYIEFWGMQNDGKADNALYRSPDFQLSDKYSLQTDTSTYFLTVNSTASNKRFINTPNNVAANTLAAEPYFIDKAGSYQKAQINPGYAVVVGEYVYSSSYDKGEGWSSGDLNPSGIITANFDPLYVYPGGPDPVLSFTATGKAINPRTIKVSVNGDTVVSMSLDYFDMIKVDSTFPITKIAGPDKALISIKNYAAVGSDRMVVGQIELKYPRKFNFGGTRNFEFQLPANTSGNYLEITNFNYGAVAPKLYDLTNKQRYTGDISTTPGTVKILLVPSLTERKLILVNDENSNYTTAANFQQRTFVNYNLLSNQGDFLIITHPVLTTGSNPVEEYRLYRNSATGGSHNTKTYLIDDLVDQFAFGIKRHPLSIRNFIRFAKDKFTQSPKNIFLIGKGIQYVHNRIFESNPDLDKLSLVPTFGLPASDNLYTANPGSSLKLLPIGRLSAINTDEVKLYLEKVKEYELAQSTTSQSFEDKKWMKNVVHVVGASDATLGTILSNYVAKYKNIISDTSFGANVHTFSKTSAASVEPLAEQRLQNLFQEGISLLTYYGHSSASTLEFNLDNPNRYNNKGKYPVFNVMGCNAGNFYNFNTLRFTAKETLSEKFVLAPERGTVAFIASTHFGIVHYLDIVNTRTYTAMAVSKYGKSLGEILSESFKQTFNLTTEQDFYARFHCEQATIHGDPSLKLNTFTKPDYVIEDPMIRVSPAFISVAESNFKVNAAMFNIGKAVNKNIVIQVKRQYPDLSTAIIFRDTIPGLRYSDTLEYAVPIIATRDKGLNKITITVDADNAVDELYETNNTVTKDVFIFEDEARPVYPYNMAIVNKQGIKLLASTANPFATLKQYNLEIDTTTLFNSPLKVTKSVTSVGGILEFTPGITFIDSTVYYWRVSNAVTTGSPVWNGASFVYLPNHDAGYNQSQFFQHIPSKNERLTLDSASRKWEYGIVNNNLFLRMGTWVTSGVVQEAGLSVALNGTASIRLTNWFSSLQFNVIDPVTFDAWQNRTITPGTSAPNNMGEGLYGSLDNHPPFASQPAFFSFEYRYTDTSSRRKMMDFMRDVIPVGHYVVVRNFTLNPAQFNTTTFPVAYAADWAADEAIHGPGQSLYHYLKNAGFEGIDSFYKVRPWGLVYKKGDPSFTPKWLVGEGMFDNPTLSVDCPTPDTLGYITSPVFGPAKTWKRLYWAGNSLDATPGDNPTIDVIGLNSEGGESVLISGINQSQQDFDVSSIDPVQYPNIKLRMRNVDSVNFTPYQLRYWRVTYTPVPEGAIAPNLLFQTRDTVEVGEPMNFKIAFKNISEANFDSLRVKITVTNKDNVLTTMAVPRQKALVVNDTVQLNYTIPTGAVPGTNYLFVDFNPDNDQPEQHHFNNFIFRTIYVKPDSLNPLMDVTFDGIHILNRDIVSSKPHIVIKLKDEAKWMTLNDTAAFKLQVKYPSGTLKPFYFNNDTVRFTPAGQAPVTDNMAAVDFLPYFTQDGDYELIVTGKDRSNNAAGRIEYRVAFQVFNKPMISNMLNYPNPFTTSTAFVFTVTGSQVPQNIRIQIMTITGKIVKEITKEELGPINIGRNITDYKWDGTDQYGQKLANGIYLYRVITNLNGKSLEKFKAEDDNTDKYFNKGYGKMYLMR